MSINPRLLERAQQESAREVRRSGQLLRFQRYVVKSRDGGDVLLVAEDLRKYRWYAPLKDPQLFVNFARLPEPITEDVMLRWVNKYGTLGLRDVFIAHEAQESLWRFREEAHDARRVLRLYELAVAERADTAEIEDVLGPLEDTEIGIDVLPGRLAIRSRADAVGIALCEVELVVRQKLMQHTYADVYLLANGVFEPGLGLESLLGAIYLQARALLITDTSEIRRCQAPDCSNIIPPGSYKNKVYCSRPANSAHTTSAGGGPGDAADITYTWQGA